jgi:hypothetical protein
VTGALVAIAVLLVVAAVLVYARGRAAAPAPVEEQAAWRSDEAYMNQVMPPESPAAQARRFVGMTKARDAERRARALVGGSR